MKAFVVYTAARLAMFAAAFGLIWLIFGRWLAWNQLSFLWTALIALVLSSVAALIWLRPLRNRFAAQVANRAERAKAAYEARITAEDDD